MEMLYENLLYEIRRHLKNHLPHLPHHFFLNMQIISTDAKVFGC